MVFFLSVYFPILKAFSFGEIITKLKYKDLFIKNKNSVPKIANF